MIRDPINDGACLGQLTRMARELAPSTLVRNVARRLGSAAKAVKWIQSLPQSDDDGKEPLQVIACDVEQRVRLFPADPNCFERAFAALALLEQLEPHTPRALISIEKPARHTALVENRGGKWEPVDLFPRRNVNWGSVGLDVLHGAHDYVGKPVLKFYLGDKVGGQVGDAVGDQEKRLDPKKPKPPAQSTPRPSAPPPQATTPTPAPAPAKSLRLPNEPRPGETSHAYAQPQAPASTPSSPSSPASRSSQAAPERWW